MNQNLPKANEAGFSLLELVIAMAVTVIMLGIAGQMLATGYRVREREESVTDAIADAQRALNIMSREISNAGFNLNTNGLVADDSNATSIRIRSNLNRWDPSASFESRNGVIDVGEDLKYFVNVANQTDYLVRHDEFEPDPNKKNTVLANRMDSLRIHYFPTKVTYSTPPTGTPAPNDCDITNPSTAEVNPALASYVVIALCVRIPAYGVASTAGYQPASNVLLVSDVTLRNSNLVNY